MINHTKNIGRPKGSGVIKPKALFWSHVDRREIDQCWPWTASFNKNGYGQFGTWIDGKTIKCSAHRFSFSLATKSDIPKGYCVCHKCDNKACVNPAHLFLGSYSQNSRDMLMKGRGRSYGKRNLLPIQVRDIRILLTLGIGVTAIANRYGVGISNVYHIKNGRAWTHLPAPSL